MTYPLMLVPVCPLILSGPKWVRAKDAKLAKG
jgi:hypothetical protein